MNQQSLKATLLLAFVFILFNESTGRNIYNIKHGQEKGSKSIEVADQSILGLSATAVTDFLKSVFDVLDADEVSVKQSKKGSGKVFEFTDKYNNKYGVENYEKYESDESDESEGGGSWSYSSYSSYYPSSSSYSSYDYDDDEAPVIDFDRLRKYEDEDLPRLPLTSPTHHPEKKPAYNPNVPPNYVSAENFRNFQYCGKAVC